MKGTEVSTVMGVVSVEIGRRREMEDERGLRRAAEREEEVARCDRAISTVGFGEVGPI